jgi:hypothetical protein
MSFLKPRKHSDVYTGLLEMQPSTPLFRYTWS